MKRKIQRQVPQDECMCGRISPRVTAASRAALNDERSWELVALRHQLHAMCLAWGQPGGHVDKLGMVQPRQTLAKIGAAPAGLHAFFHAADIFAVLGTG